MSATVKWATRDAAAIAWLADRGFCASEGRRAYFSEAPCAVAWCLFFYLIPWSVLAVTGQCFGASCTQADQIDWMRGEEECHAPCHNVNKTVDGSTRPSFRCVDGAYCANRFQIVWKPNSEQECTCER